MWKGHRIHLVVAGVLAAVTTVVTGHPVGATTTTTGPGTFEGAVVLNQGFPCGGCNGGVFTGTAAMSVSGVPQAGLVYTATWPDPRTTPPVPSNLSANFGYSDSCLVSNSLPSVLGTASGSFTLGGGLLVLNGTAWDNATLTGTFTWQRIGTAAQVSLFGLSITGGSGPSLVAVNISLNGTIIGQGAATFVWTNGPGTCAVQNPYQTADVAGAVEQPA